MFILHVKEKTVNRSQKVEWEQIARCFSPVQFYLIFFKICSKHFVRECSYFTTTLFNIRNVFLCCYFTYLKALEISFKFWDTQKQNAKLVIWKSEILQTTRSYKLYKQKIKKFSASVVNVEPIAMELSCQNSEGLNKLTYMTVDMFICTLRIFIC